MATPYRHVQRIGWPVALLALLVVSGSIVSVPERADCEVRFGEFEDEYRAYVATKNENWEDLLPVLNEVKACYGATHSAETARLADYETSLYFKLGRYEEAEAAFSQFFEHDAELAAPAILAAVYQRRGGLYSRTDRPLEALQDYIFSARFVHALPSAEGAEFLIRIAAQFRGLGDFDAAVPFYLQADSLVNANIADDPRLEGVRGRLLANRAVTILLRANRNGTGESAAAAEAALLLEDALGMIPPDDPDFLYERVQALLWLAHAYRNLGDPERALPLIALAKTLSMPAIRRYPSRVSWTYTELGKTQLALGNFDEAHQALQTALSMDREIGRPEHERQSLVDLGLLAEAVADTSAVPSYGLAIAYYQRAISLAEIERRAFGNLEWSASFFEGLQTPYRNLIGLFLRQGRFEEAFLKLDETRARHLQDLRLTNRLRLSLDDERRARLDSLETIEDDARYESLNPNLSAARQSQLRLAGISAREDANLVIGFSPSPPPPLTLSNVQRTLEEREQTLLTYFLERDEAYALVVRPDTLVGTRLPISADSLAGLIRRMGQAWHDTAQPDPLAQTDVLAALRAVLIQPIEHLLEPGDALVIIPEGPLSALPFAALPSSPVGESDFADLDYFGRSHPISMELSAALLTEPLRVAKPTNDLLAFGRSDFGEDAESVRTRMGVALADLPNVPAELSRLRRLFPIGKFALDQEATETALYNDLGSTRVIHLASHAVVNATLPMFSYIALSDDAAEDGTLFLYELQNQSLASELVVLSGCSTARGQQHLGEGMIGLQHAFRAAGASSTLATLWQVDDEAMPELMNAFYTHLRRGHRKDRALQLAQMDYLNHNSGVRASPFFWASAALYGSPEPVDWQQSHISTRTWLVVGIVLLLIGVTIPYMLRRREQESASA